MGKQKESTVNLNSKEIQIDFKSKLVRKDLKTVEYKHVVTWTPSLNCCSAWRWINYQGVGLSGVQESRMCLHFVYENTTRSRL